MKVKAPDGYHWMKRGNSYKLMKDPAGGYKPHKGASKSANFEVQKTHKKIGEYNGLRSGCIQVET